MVAPAINYSIRGFLWYQGEANSGRPVEYQQLLTALINDWRGKWQQGPLPFLYVQLPNFMEVKYSPSESQWAELRFSQLKTLSVPNTAMAVTIDAGEWNDIHPLQKKVVGDRLALAARKLAYGETNLVYSGPTLKSAVEKDGEIILSFDNTGSGLMIRGGGDPGFFSVAGADRKFYWADAILRDNKVILKCGMVPSPVYVRYAWADNPEWANLYNAEGLPASPFETNTGN
jgi:sialate O-acetylesterase